MSKNCSNNSKNKRPFWRPRNNRGSARYVTTTSLRGGRFSPSTNPPDITYQPWYPLTLVWTGRVGSFTIGGVGDKLKDQLDPGGHCFSRYPTNTTNDASFRFQFKKRSISIWNLTGRVIGLSVNDDSGKDSTEQLGGWVDCGGPSAFPAVGFKYPISHSELVYRPDSVNDAIPIFTTSGGTGDTILVHFSILWKPDGPISIKGTKIPDVLAGIAKLNQSIKELANKQPDSSFINKVGAFASYVIPLALATDPREGSGPTGLIDTLSGPRERTGAFGADFVSTPSVSVSHEQVSGLIDGLTSLLESLPISVTPDPLAEKDRVEQSLPSSASSYCALQDDPVKAEP